jgi:hypothetical protein
MKAQPKLDLYKTHRDEYAAPKQPVLLHIKPARYLAISGQGAPGGNSFTARIGALYAIAFTVKMTRKFAGRRDYAVCKLEGQWFFDDEPAKIPKDQWRWKLLIRTPDFVTPAELDKAAATLLQRGKPAEVKEVKLERLEEGRCVQMLHVGPYEREPETMATMKSFAGRKGLQLAGPHHEIYLSDPRRVPPERLRTILRAPVAKSTAGGLQPLAHARADRGG